MSKLRCGFAIFWRMLALDVLVQFSIFALLIGIMSPVLLQSYGEFFIKLKPTIFYAVFALVLFFLCHKKLTNINRFVWQRVFVASSNWTFVYKNYAQVAMMLVTCPGIFRPSEIRDNGSLTARSSDEESTIYGRTDRSHIARS